MQSRLLPARVNASIKRTISARASQTTGGRSIQRAFPLRLSYYGGIAAVGLATAFWIDTKSPTGYTAPDPDGDPLDALSYEALNHSSLHLVNRRSIDLLRSYVIYLASSSSIFVAASGWAIASLETMRQTLPPWIMKVPWSIAEAITRRTAFAMFAGGETAQGCYPLLDRLAAESTSGLLCYSAEGQDSVSTSRLGSHSGGLITENIAETLQAIRAAGMYSPSQSEMTIKPTWVAIKLTGLVQDPSLLERASEALISSSSYQRGERASRQQLFPPSPLLSQEDEETLTALHEQLQLCGKLARHLRVRVDIDAEQSWFMPAIDRFYTLLAESYNKTDELLTTPVIYQTFQCYLRDARTRLHAEQAWAKEKGLLFGAKLVRGAYVEAENARATRLKRPSPLWPDKASTDACFDNCARDMVDAIAEEIHGPYTPASGVMFASHNGKSVRLVLERFREVGLIHKEGAHLAVDDRLRGRIVFGQLLGMADTLTAALARILGPASPDEFDTDSQDKPMPYVLKYVPYGAVSQVLPYLVRRAQENQAMLSGHSSRGGVREERKACGRELRRRMMSWLF